MRTVLVALIAAGCHDSSKTSGSDADPDPIDADGDGFDATVDCDDSNVDVYPGAYDPWYDGIDQDCAGNDDLDQDGDGAEAADHGGDDCNDHDATIGPASPEVPYDGIDQDCNPATPDDDLDGDGFPNAQDCDDGDADRYPGATELLDDGIDQDCDGVVDGAAWGFADLSYLDPQRPILGVTDDYVVLTVLAHDVESDSDPALATYVTPGLLLSLDKDGVNGAPLAVDPAVWYGVTDADPISTQALAIDGGQAVLGTTYFSSSNRYGYLAVRPLSWLGPGVGWFLEPASYHARELTSWSHTDLRLDPDGSPWLCAAGPDGIAYFHGDATSGSPGASLDGVDAGRGCFWNADREFTTLDSTGAATTWDVDPSAVDPPTVSADQPFAGTWRTGRSRDGVALAIGDEGFVTVDASGQTSTWYDTLEFVDADLASQGGETWIAGVVDRGSGPEVLLADEGTERWFTVQDGSRSLEPTGVAVALTPDRVILAVSAIDANQTGRDEVGWAMYPRP